MRLIHVRRVIGDRFGEPVAELLRLMNLIFQYKSDEITIDFKLCSFISPFLIITLHALREKLIQNGYRINFNYEGASLSVQNYLKIVRFQESFLPEKFVHEGVVDPNMFREALSDYKTRTYIPLISFPAGKTTEQTKVRDVFLSVLNEIIRNQVGAIGQMQSAISYLLDESIVNVTDHSGADRGYIFGQFYPNKGYMDICIADSGISILGSYKKAKKTQVDTHAKAIQFALDGISTKVEVTGRGYGIRTSRNMLVNGLKGQYLLISGNAAFYHRQDVESIFNIDPTIYWQGVVVYMRLPVVPSSNFVIYEYLERG